MTLDERVRDGLRRSADTLALDADDMFDGVVASHRRGRVRSRVVRQATAVAVVLTLFAGVAVLVSWRNAPARYRSVTTLTAPTILHFGARSVKFGDPARVALAPTTRRATLLAAHLAPDDTHVEFRATSTGVETVSLAATAPTARESAVVADSWVSVLTSFRRASARRQLIQAIESARHQATLLRQQLEAVDAKLAKMDPKLYGSVWKWDSQPRNDSSEPPQGVPPPVPENGTVAELNLAFERIQLRSRLEKLGVGSGGVRYGGGPAPIPIVTVQPGGRKAATRVDTTPSTAVPLIGWGAGIGLIAAAAFVVYRRRSARVLRT